MVMTWISAIGLIVHVFLSWLCISKLGWGLVGAALTLNITWWIIVICQLVYAVRWCPGANNLHLDNNLPDTLPNKFIHHLFCKPREAKHHHNFSNNIGCMNMSAQFSPVWTTPPPLNQHNHRLNHCNHL
jgi:hypothetical protein